MNHTRSIRSLTAEELKTIKQVMRSDHDAQLRVRANAVWLSHQGYKADEIAKILDRHRNSVVSWFDRYESHGLEGLRNAPRNGRPPKAGPEFQERLVQAVKTPPHNLGYSFTTWSAGRLVDHMDKQTGIRISEIQLRRLLYKNGIVFRKPKHDLKAKQDPALYSQKKELLEFVKKTQFPILPVLSCCFWTSVTFISILS